MYISELKRTNPESKIDPKMGVGRFLDELKDEPDILVGFTIFLAEEFLKNGQKDPSKESQVVPVIQNQADWNSDELLKANIEKLKQQYSNKSKVNFNMEQFQADSQ